jgi:esterase/lipase
MVDLKKIKCNQLTVMFGKNDTVINLNKTIDMLKSSKINFNEMLFNDSDHNLLEGIEKTEVVNKIINILNN